MKTLSFLRRGAFALALFITMCASNASALGVPKPTATGYGDGVSGYTQYIYVSWKGVSGAKKYYIYRSTSSKFSKRVKIKAVSKKVRSFKDTSAKPGVTYWYWIGSVSKPTWKNGFRSKVYTSKKKYARGVRALVSPKPVASYNTYSSYIKVTWGAAAYAKKYKVMRSTNSSYYYARLVATTTSRVFYDTSATSGVTYYYWILPVGQNGKGWYNTSKYDYGRRLGSLSVPQPYIDRYNNHIELYWSSVPGAVKYYIFCTQSSSGHFDVWESYDARWTTTNTYLYDNDLGRATWYYWVCPVDASGTWWYNSSKYACGYLVR